MASPNGASDHAGATIDNLLHDGWYGTENIYSSGGREYYPPGMDAQYQPLPHEYAQTHDQSNVDASNNHLQYAGSHGSIEEAHHNEFDAYQGDAEQYYQDIELPSNGHEYAPDSDSRFNHVDSQAAAYHDGAYGDQQNHDESYFNISRENSLHGGSLSVSNAESRTYESSDFQGNDVTSGVTTSMEQFEQQDRNIKGDIVDLIDDDDEDNDLEESSRSNDNSSQDRAKRLKLDSNQPSGPAVASYIHRADNMPSWMTNRRPHSGIPIVAGQSLPGVSPMDNARNSISQLYQATPLQAPAALQQPSSSVLNGPLARSMYKFDEPTYIPFPEGFTPSWDQLMPPKTFHVAPIAATNTSNQRKNYELSLLNVNEFTITGLPISYDGPPTPVSGLRAIIKRISREHGKAVYERDKEGGGGKWRIPLGAYQAFLAYLTSDPLTRVHRIPEMQLKIASIERERQERGYPTADELIERGVPGGLAKALAPFQRGGVDFVIQKGGRALIADDMGLGKTIQGIASMSVYHSDWPLLVLTPSSARYHWENEFRNWLGIDSNVNKTSVEDSDHIWRKGPLLLNEQIHVLSSSKDSVLPRKDTKVVICSYGLAPILIARKKIVPRKFRCAIVDESHMLKNKSTKRTSALLPILCATDRCVLLSGTPALARPLELWPQLVILDTETQGYWTNESDFIERYIKQGGPTKRAELHAMLTGTVMIRRMKGDILKTLPSKSREKAELHLLTEDQRSVFKNLLRQLRRSKGTLGNIARAQYAHNKRNEESMDADTAAGIPMFNRSKSEARAESYLAAKAEIELEKRTRLDEGRNRIQNSLAAVAHELPADQRSDLELELEGKLREEIEQDFQDRMGELDQRYGNVAVHPTGHNEPDTERTAVLSRLYSLTGEVKIPVLVDMLDRWLRDPTKGKVCIFAHHLSVLDSIRDHSQLSNDKNGQRKFIRIDGATSPRSRQEQINAFQSDPSVRVALLGITAAGVAVTLTASSTVWFAELFWTPAIMIQAEDRCHRIGQQARVKCLYFVAKGTLDDILWKLVEKKFQDLGEFVEGKEKMKMVIHKIYHNVKSLHEMFVTQDTLDEEVDEYEFGEQFSDELELDGDLVHDIEELGEEERRMLQQMADEEDEGEVTGSDEKGRKPSALEQDLKPSPGASEQDAISLLDDEADDEKPSATIAQSSLSESGGSTSSKKQHFQLYKIYVGNQLLEVSMFWFQGRIVIQDVAKERLDRLGENCKPRVGDVLVGINGQALPKTGDLPSTMALLQSSIYKNAATELIFAEGETFRVYFAKYMEALAKRQKQIAAPVKQNEDGVIELLDDD